MAWFITLHNGKVVHFRGYMNPFNSQRSEPGK